MSQESPSLSVRNLEKTYRADGGADAVEVLRGVKLAERFRADLGKKMREYSTGNTQKIGLIQAFMNRPASSRERP